MNEFVRAMELIKLRRLNIDDCSEEYLSWIKSESNRAVVTSITCINSMDELISSTKERICDPLVSLVGIFEDDIHIGNIQARIVGSGLCIISILIGNPSRRGAGIGRTALNIFFETSDLWPVVSQAPLTCYAVIKSSNQASIRLFSSLRFCKYQGPDWPSVFLPRDTHTVLYVRKINSPSWPNCKDSPHIQTQPV